jgi:hypothetical protein
LFESHTLEPLQLFFGHNFRHRMGAVDVFEPARYLRR